MDAVNVRNLEQIREHELRTRRSRLGSLVLASLGGAGVVVVLVIGSTRSSKHSREDALADIAGKQASALAGPVARVDRQQVSFPSLLSDSDKPTTALAAVRDEHGRLVTGTLEPDSRKESDSDLPKVPTGDLAAAEVMGNTAQPLAAKDSLSRLAISATQSGDDKELAQEGREGGVQIQVASFRSLDDAETLVKDLRHKGHHAYRQPAYVPDRGLWQRVRIGPFKSRIEALAYRRKLEQSERLLAFVIDPDRKKQTAERDSVLSNREKPRD